MSLEFSEILQLLKNHTAMLKNDSRQVKPGDVFIALPPADKKQEDHSDEYIKMAIQNGASYIIAEKRSIFPEAKEVSFVEVDNIYHAQGMCASAFFGTESLGIPIVGITGTNGKTTCAYLLEYFFHARNVSCGILGTISYRWNGFCQPAPLTTPGCLTVHQYLKEMVQAGAKIAVMEVSSHSIDQERVGGVPFSAAAFTNLTQDHLDYHGTMENYFQTKRRLFMEFPQKNKAAIINADDAYGMRLLKELPNALGYGINTFLPDRPFLKAEILKSDRSGLSIRLIFVRGEKEEKPSEEILLTTPLVGLHNVSNILTVGGILLSLGYPLSELKLLEGFTGVPGRLERIPFGKEDSPFKKEDTGVFIDYAHTPDALTRVLKTLRDSHFKRIITLFGCGGNRDRSKRPIMGKAVVNESDITIVTTDNPRHEDPEKIIDDIMEGIEDTSHLYRICDRREAIKMGVSLLEPGDALLLAGKGHENYQQIGDIKYPFNEKDIVSEALLCK